MTVFAPEIFSPFCLWLLNIKKSAWIVGLKKKSYHILIRTVTVEEREKAAKVMSEYLHDLKRSLDKQEMDISDERARLQVGHRRLSF